MVEATRSVSLLSFYICHQWLHHTKTITDTWLTTGKKSTYNMKYTYPHQDKSLSFGFFCLRQVKVHFITIKVSVIRRAHTLIEAECPVRFDSGLQHEEEYTTCVIRNTSKKNKNIYIYIYTPSGLQQGDQNWCLNCSFFKSSSRGSAPRLTIWAMMLSLCRDGCRLKSTMSPSIRCLSTMSPNLSSWAIFSRFPYFKNLKEGGCQLASASLPGWGQKKGPLYLFTWL